MIAMTNPQFNGYRFTVALSAGARNYTAYATGVSSNTSRYDYYSDPGFRHPVHDRQ